MTAADGLQTCSPSGVTPDVCPLRYRSATKQSSLISFLFLYQVPASADGCWAGLQLLLLWNCEAVRATSREAAAVNRRTVGLILFTWSRLELHNWISQPTFPLFFKSYLCFFSAAAWFSPSISLISSSQPSPVISSIQQMFFFPRTQGDVCLDVDVCFSVMRRLVVVFLLCCSVLVGNIWLDFPFERWIFCNLSLRFRSPHSEHTLAPILPNPAASSVALNF